jgi:hypothetical protein
VVYFLFRPGLDAPEVISVIEVIRVRVIRVFRVSRFFGLGLLGSVG